MMRYKKKYEIKSWKEGEEAENRSKRRRKSSRRSEKKKKVQEEEEDKQDYTRVIGDKQEYIICKSERRESSLITRRT